MKRRNKEEYNAALVPPLENATLACKAQDGLVINKDSSLNLLPCSASSVLKTEVIPSVERSSVDNDDDNGTIMRSATSDSQCDSSSSSSSSLMKLN